MVNLFNRDIDSKKNLRSFRKGM